MITRLLSEHGQQDSLFGRDRRGRLRRALREGEQTTDDPRDHLVNAIAAAHREGNHDLGHALSKQLEEWDDADAENEGESQAGRGKPFKDEGETNDQKGGKGKENMESRQRRRSRGGLPVLEASDRKRLDKVKSWTERLLRG